MRHTTKRVSQILDLNRSRATRVWKPALGLVAVFSGLCLVVVTRAPEIAFQDPAPNVAAAAPLPAVKVPVIAAKWGEPAARPVSTRANHRAMPSSAKAIPARHDSVPGAVDVNALNAELGQPRSIENLLPVNGIELPTDSVAVQTVFVVMQGGERDPSQGYWTLCVWRVTVRSTGDRALIKAGIPAKSI